MDIFEKLNKSFAGWYESWFGSAESDLRPKDVLRKIVGVMEDNRKEGLDGRVYVPNKYILEIAFENDDEREYLLAFLDKDELESALRKYMSQNKYFTRGPLDFTIEEIAPAEDEQSSEKLRVKCKWDVRAPLSEEIPSGITRVAGLADGLSPETSSEEEAYTVASTDVCDAGTVAPPILRVKRPDGSSEHFPLTKPVTLIGRSHRLGNDLVIDRDGMVSKRHAKIILGAGGFTIADLDSTNGVWVNDERVPSVLLKSGNTIRLGATELVFDDPGIRSQAVMDVAPCRPRLVIDREGGAEEFRLPSEMTIGRSLTSDVRLADPSVAQRHAKISSSDGEEFYLEDLGSEAGTRVNDVIIPKNSPVKLRPGDRIQIGEVGLRFEVD